MCVREREMKTEAARGRREHACACRVKGQLVGAVPTHTRGGGADAVSRQAPYRRPTHREASLGLLFKW